MSIRTLNVALGARSYPIYIGSGLLQDDRLLKKHVVAEQVLIVSNETVAKWYLPRLQAAFTDYQCDVVLLPDGEEYKNITSLSLLFDKLIAAQHRRTTTLIALGGGVIGDMTGFAAACYQRGVAFIQIPTTLLSQVDASVGGKTAINHPLGKNMIGAFHQPRCVIIDTDTLKTLPNREFNAGLAEIIKAALLADVSFLTWLEENLALLKQRDTQALTEAIARACAIKAEIVAIDETEQTDIRALLNLGHTFGHAIEQLLGYGEWLHGEAVAVGIVLAADLSAELGWISHADVNRVKQILSAAELPIQLPASIQCDKMWSVMAIDKKKLDSQLRLVLLKALGCAAVTKEVTADQVRQVLQRNTKLI